MKANVKKTKNDKKQKFQVSLTRKTSFLVLFAETIYTVIAAWASLAGVLCIRDVMVLEVNWKIIASLNVKHVKTSKQAK